MRRNTLSGFTLVELLIVVAIIGVLSTIGVPTYRTMVQKAKKSEAKVALGGLYTAETAFQAEYGTYGSVLSKVGFDLEGNPGQRIYTIGFPQANCSAAAAVFPTSASVLGSNLIAVYPGYYSGTGTSNTIYAGKGASSCGAAIVSQTVFTATAGGIIGNSSTLSDVWTINQARSLTNVIDGVSK